MVLCKYSSYDRTLGKRCSARRIFDTLCVRGSKEKGVKMNGNYLKEGRVLPFLSECTLLMALKNYFPVEALINDHQEELPCCHSISCCDIKLF